VIYVNFTRAVYSDEEANGTIIITIVADGYTMWSFSVVVTPVEIGGPSMLLLTTNNYIQSTVYNNCMGTPYKCLTKFYKIPLISWHT